MTAPHDVLASHFPVESVDSVLCACERTFYDRHDWAMHALGRVGLDGDNFAPTGTAFPEMR